MSAERPGYHQPYRLCRDRRTGAESAGLRNKPEDHVSARRDAHNVPAKTVNIMRALTSRSTIFDEMA